jgi:DNA-binding MarR family transcriptional regulator
LQIVSRDGGEKARLVARLIDEMRETSTVTIMFHQAIADRLGMNVTDHKCAGILARSGPITAGELARRTGLTTGAITGVVDRLEKSGFARRTRDPLDRRRVIIEPNAKQVERKIAPMFDSMARAAARLYEQYSARELALILDFAARSRAVAEEETRKLREHPTPTAQTTPARRQARHNDH